MPSFQPVEMPVPPMLEAAIGYDGNDRYVAFYWTPFGDEIMWDTGWSSAAGQWAAWLIFVRHPRIAPALSPYNLGGSDQQAAHWLLLDRHDRTLAVGLANDVHTFLREANRPATLEGQPDTEATPLVIDDAFLDEFVNQMEEVQSTVTSEELYANLADQDQQQRGLQAWLNTQAG